MLDEATASLDPISERRVIDSYEAVMRGRTTLLISHRFEMARRADRVLVIDGARIVEEGEPAALVAQGGVFASLFATEAQAHSRGPGARGMRGAGSVAHSEAATEDGQQ